MATQPQQIDEVKTIDLDANCLMIDTVITRQNVVKRIENLLLNYVENNYTINKYRMDRKNCLWDKHGLVRIDKNSISVSELNRNKSRNQSAIWTVIAFIYQRLQKREFHTIQNRGLYYQLLNESKLFETQNKVDKMVLSLVND